MPRKKARHQTATCRLAGLTRRNIGARYGKIGSTALSTTHRKVRQGKYPIAPVVNTLLIQLTAKRRRKWKLIFKVLP